MPPPITKGRNTLVAPLLVLCFQSYVQAFLISSSISSPSRRNTLARFAVIENDVDISKDEILHSKHIGDNVNFQQQERSRRDFLSVSLLGVMSSSLILPVLPSHAGEVGARITKAVTQSDLGISVRTQVVKGAQVMDQMDGQWERLSDRFGLGAERNKQVGRPAPKVIPDPLPLDVPTAEAILRAADETFVSLMVQQTSGGIKPEQLDDKISQIAELVRPSFQRSSSNKNAAGEALDLGSNVRDVKTAAKFNFASYVHFKAYSDLILLQGKAFDFNTFRRNFESLFGQRLVALLLQQSTKQNQQQKTEQVLNSRLSQIDQLCEALKAKGLISLSERSPVDKEQVGDWLEDLSDLTFTVAVDGDITLGSQMLLQEQGFRLYPDYARFAVISLLQDIQGQVAQIEDYYFDTDYNSDPDKFEVKEVVLNIVLDSP